MYLNNLMARIFIWEGEENSIPKLTSTFSFMAVDNGSSGPLLNVPLRNVCSTLSSHVTEDLCQRPFKSSIDMNTFHFWVSHYKETSATEVWFLRILDKQVLLTGCSVQHREVIWDIFMESVNKESLFRRDLKDMLGFNVAFKLWWIINTCFDCS